MSNNLRIVIACIVMFAGFLYLQFFSHSEAVPLRKEFEEFPKRLGHWVEVSCEDLDSKTLNILKVTDYINRNYQNGRGEHLNFYIGYFESQKAGEVIHSPKHCLPGTGWETGRYQAQWVPIDGFGGGGIKVNRYVVQKGLRKSLVFYWYQSRGRIVTNEYLARIYLVWDAITRHRTDGALVRVIIPFTSSYEEVLRLGIEFIQEAMPVLQDYLPN